MARPFKFMRNPMNKIKKKSPTQKKQKNHNHLKSSRYVIYIIRMESDIMVYEDWISHNLLERAKTHNLDFKVSIVSKEFDEMSFESASNYTANLISNVSPNIYVALSGGLDSEYVLTTFCRLGIQVTPIIAICEGNELERQYAFRVCKTLGVTPITIEYSNHDLVSGMVRVNKMFRGRAIYAITTFLLAEYIKDRDGILVTGDHFIDDDNPLDSVLCCEWDFYASILNDKNIQFFLYTRELCYAMIKATNTTDTQEFKSKLYGLNWRPKINYAYNKGVNEIFNEILKRTFARAGAMYKSYNKIEFLKKMKQ